MERSLKVFLDRHEFKDTAIALGLPAQRAVTRCVTLPLVDRKKIGEVMQYEVKQQIPLPSESIGWDYQVLKMWSADEHAAEAACIADTRVALLAMKQEEVGQRSSLLTGRNIKLDVLQSDAAALLNFLMHERPETIKQDGEEVEPLAWAALDIGTDCSNFAITNGHSIFVRSIPLGGDDFTRALVKRYRLQPAQAEALKRNPTRAPLLHELYDALEPCVNGLLSEIQRSIDQYRSAEISSTIRQLYVRGGGLRLHGLLRAICHRRKN